MAISKIVNHPDYQHSTTNDDFSLLKMKKTIDFSKYAHIRPICIPADASKDYTDFTATVSGWGTLSSGGSTSNQPDAVCKCKRRWKGCLSGRFRWSSCNFWVWRRCDCWSELRFDRCCVLGIWMCRC